MFATFAATVHYQASAAQSSGYNFNGFNKIAINLTLVEIKQLKYSKCVFIFLSYDEQSISVFMQFRTKLIVRAYS